MKKSKRLLIIFGLLLVIFPGCDKNKVFEGYKSIPGAVWERDSIAQFIVPVTDTVMYNNLYVNIRNNISYPYSNLWLFIEIAQPNGESVKDTFELTLADPLGKWTGDGFGDLRTLQAIYRENVYFPVAGEYKINIQQGMRVKGLTGISDIGLRVEKNQRSGKE